MCWSMIAVRGCWVLVHLLVVVGHLLGPRDTHQVLVVGVGHGHAGQEEQSGHVLHVVGRVDRRGLKDRLSVTEYK